MYLSSGMTTYFELSVSKPHSFAANLLRLKLGIYGRAVKHIDVHFHWANKKTVRGFCRKQAKDFNSSLKSLPKVIFDKRSRRIEVEVVSSRFFEEQKENRPSKTDLKHGNAEFLAALKHIKEEGKLNIALLDIDRLIRESTRILHADIPNAAERNLIDQWSSEWSCMAIANTWPFERLIANDEYWTLFHPNARSLLVTPNFWTKELGSPHGSDVGADVFREFQSLECYSSTHLTLKVLAGVAERVEHFAARAERIWERTSFNISFEDSSCDGTLKMLVYFSTIDEIALGYAFCCLQTPRTMFS